MIQKDVLLDIVEGYRAEALGALLRCGEAAMALKAAHDEGKAIGSEDVMAFFALADTARRRVGDWFNARWRYLSITGRMPEEGPFDPTEVEHDQVGVC